MGSSKATMYAIGGGVVFVGVIIVIVVIASGKSCPSSWIVTHGLCIKVIDMVQPVTFEFASKRCITEIPGSSLLIPRTSQEYEGACVALGKWKSGGQWEAWVGETYDKTSQKVLNYRTKEVLPNFAYLWAPMYPDTSSHWATCIKMVFPGCHSANVPCRKDNVREAVCQIYASDIDFLTKLSYLFS